MQGFMTPRGVLAAALLIVALNLQCVHGAPGAVRSSHGISIQKGTKPKTRNYSYQKHRPRHVPEVRPLRHLLHLPTSVSAQNCLVLTNQYSEEPSLPLQLVGTSQATLLTIRAWVPSADGSCQRDDAGAATSSSQRARRAAFGDEHRLLEVWCHFRAAELINSRLQRYRCVALHQD